MSNARWPAELYGVDLVAFDLLKRCLRLTWAFQPDTYEVTFIVPDDAETADYPTIIGITALRSAGWRDLFV